MLSAEVFETLEEAFEFSDRVRHESGLFASGPVFDTKHSLWVVFHADMEENESVVERNYH